ncbi:MAG: XRE family transcriptional regulator [Beijerinckiaceae bacterium]|nr:XRE family transcriptional regulator [Beijerinckiaceae bacterium]
MNANADEPWRAASPGNVNAAVGRVIRELRDLKRITARDLAARAGVSSAMISRIESGQVSPSLSMLEMLAAALETPIAALFRDTGSAVSDFTHVRQGEGLKSRRMMGDHVHDFAALGFHRRHDMQFEAVMVTLERHDEVAPPTYTGHGCVFIYVLEGEALYRYGRQEVHLKEGDSICLDAELRYGVQKVLTRRLRFLSVQAERR